MHRVIFEIPPLFPPQKLLSFKSHLSPKLRIQAGVSLLVARPSDLCCPRLQRLWYHTELLPSPLAYPVIYTVILIEYSDLGVTYGNQTIPGAASATETPGSGRRHAQGCGRAGRRAPPREDAEGFKQENGARGGREGPRCPPWGSSRTGRGKRRERPSPAVLGKLRQGSNFKQRNPVSGRGCYIFL